MCCSVAYPLRPTRLACCLHANPPPPRTCDPLNIFQKPRKILSLVVNQNKAQCARRPCHTIITLCNTIHNMYWVTGMHRTKELWLMLQCAIPHVPQVIKLIFGPNLCQLGHIFGVSCHIPCKTPTVYAHPLPKIPKTTLKSL